MNNKEIILFGLGFLIGYMVISAKKNKASVSSNTQNLPDSFEKTVPPAKVETISGNTKIQEPEVMELTEDPKIKSCKEKWIKFAETRKFGSQEQMQNTYDNFMTSCVAQS